MTGNLSNTSNFNDGCTVNNCDLLLLPIAVIGWLGGSVGLLTDDHPLAWTILLTFLKPGADNS